MDKNYLKFWGTMFNQAAENQQQIEQVTQWLNDGLKGSESFVNMFKDFLNAGAESGKKTDTLDDEAIFKELHKSFDAFLTTFGMVPQSEYLSLSKKYEDLKKTVVDQKETIDHLRMMLDEKAGSSTGTIKAFQNMAEKQAEQFTSLMNNLNSFYKTQASNNKDGE